MNCTAMASVLQDFGLSKVVDEGQTQGMELTSQGAGTYWCVRFVLLRAVFA